MHISAILKQNVSFRSKENSHQTVPIKTESDSFEKNTQDYNRHKKDMLFHDAIELAKEIGMQDKNIEKSIEIAERMSGHGPSGMTLLNIICAQKEFQFDNMDKLFTFAILEYCETAHDKSMFEFAQDENNAKYFMQIMNECIFNNKDKPFNLNIPVEVYTLMNKAGNDKKKLQAMIEVYKHQNKSENPPKDLVNKICQFFDVNKNVRLYHRNKQSFHALV